MVTQSSEIPRLYAIADADVLGDELVEAVAILSGEGVRWVQLRLKGVPDDQAFRWTEQCLDRLVGSSTRIWINDRVDLARMVNCFGVHLGQRDMAPKDARKVLGSDSWIGFSTHDLAQASEAELDSAVDAVAIGPIFPTTGKVDPDPVVGLQSLRQIREMVTKPLIAIGGITVDRIPALLDLGVDSVALIGAVCRGDVRHNVRLLQRVLKGSPH